MSDAPEDPPLVNRVEAAAPAARSPALRGFLAMLEATGWAAFFVSAQLFTAVVGVLVAFLIFVMQAPNAKTFVDEQLEGIGKALQPEAPGETRPPVPNEMGQALAWGMLAAQLGSLVVIAVVLPRRIGRDWKRQLGIRKPYPLHLLLVLLVLPGFLITADIIQTLFLTATGLKPPTALKALNSIFGTFPWPLTALAVAIGPGVVEELWCRGLLGRVLSPRIGLVAGVLFTSVLFAVMHVDPTQLLVIVLMGLYLHFVYLASRSIWVPILLHAGNNGIAIILALTLSQEAIDGPMPVIVPLVAVSLMIFGSVALWTSRARLEPVTRKDEAWWESDGWKPDYPGISTPPPEANVRIEHAPVSPAALVFTVASFGALLYLGYRFLI